MFIKLLLNAIFFSIIYKLNAENFDLNECTIKKNCVSVPENCITKTGNFSKCLFIFTYINSEQNENDFTLELITKYVNSNEKYLAVGFSDDLKMGNEPVISCGVKSSGETLPILSKNIGTSNEQFTKSLDSQLEVLNTLYANGIFYCKLRKKLNPSLDQSYKIDIENQKYIMFAKGDFIDNLMEYHENKVIVPKPIKLKDRPLIEIDLNLDSSTKILTTEQTTQQTTSPLPKQQPENKKLLTAYQKGLLVYIHGLFMCIAWIGCIAIGIYSSRYIRDLFDTEIFGIKIWFHIHRTLNVLGIVLIILSMISVLLVTEFTWLGPWFNQTSESNLSSFAFHCLTGAISTFAAIIQPLNALLRCGPQNPQRTIFNIFHRTIGLIGLVTAIIAIGIAIFVFKRHWKSPATFYIYAISIAILIVISVISELLMFKTKMYSKTRITAIEMTTSDVKLKKDLRNSVDAFPYQNSAIDSALIKYRKALFGLSGLILIGCALILVILIR